MWGRRLRFTRTGRSGPVAVRLQRLSTSQCLLLGAAPLCKERVAAMVSTPPIGIRCRGVPGASLSRGVVCQWWFVRVVDSRHLCTESIEKCLSLKALLVLPLCPGMGLLCASRCLRLGECCTEVAVSSPWRGIWRVVVLVARSGVHDEHHRQVVSGPFPLLTRSSPLFISAVLSASTRHLPIPETSRKPVYGRCDASPCVSKFHLVSNTKSIDTFQQMTRPVLSSLS